MGFRRSQERGPRHPNPGPQGDKPTAASKQAGRGPQGAPSGSEPARPPLDSPAGRAGSGHRPFCPHPASQKPAPLPRGQRCGSWPEAAEGHDGHSSTRCWSLTRRTAPHEAGVPRLQSGEKALPPRDCWGTLGTRAGAESWRRCHRQEVRAEPGGGDDSCCFMTGHSAQTGRRLARSHRASK